MGPMRLKFGAIFLVAVLVIAADHPREITGKVVKIADGDTLTILVGEDRQRVRLHGIDCPERGQPFGTKAKEYALEHAAGKAVSVKVRDRDRYGRLVGEVILPDGRNLNHDLVRAGLAWWYERYAPKDSQLKALELEAREAKRGLWAEPEAMPPWEWRRKKKGV